jgi:hypothetical protein
MRSFEEASVDTFRLEVSWERTVVLELSGYHEYVCREHKAYLRPIAIALFDSDSRWGEYNHLARTIFISRRLVKEHSWDKVRGVLRHEMAHQLAAESAPDRFHLEGPHGELFKAACRRLGVPTQFSKAGLDLATCDLDWRTEPRSELTDRVLEKAKKLLALAKSTNEHEAHSAMERVRELYARYNLGQTSSRDGFVHLVITHRKKRMEASERRTISILTRHFFVKAITFQQFDAKMGARVHALELIGTRENVLMAEYVYHFLLRQADFLVNNAAAGKRVLGRTERSSFRLGVLDGFDKKLSMAEKARPPSEGVATTRAVGTASGEALVIGKALAKFRDDPLLASYISEVYPRLAQHRSSNVAVDSGAFAAGHAAGRSIVLNKPISTQMGNLGRFLTDGSS